jgi:hypothetical protein
MTQKEVRLYQALQRFTQEVSHDRSISIIPHGLIGYKNIKLQVQPFLEIKHYNTCLFLGAPFRGAHFIIFYPEHRLDVLKPLLSSLVLLLERGHPLIIMPYKGLDWMFLPLLQINLSAYGTNDAELFLKRLKEEKEHQSQPMPDYALSNTHRFCIDYINRENRIPIDMEMKVSPQHVECALQGETHG